MFQECDKPHIQKSITFSHYSDKRKHLRSPKLNDCGLEGGETRNRIKKLIKPRAKTNKTIHIPESRLKP